MIVSATDKKSIYFVTRTATSVSSPANSVTDPHGFMRVCGLSLLTLCVACALNPVARGQPRPVRGRRAQPAAAPWPPTAWAGLPTVALHGGHAPRIPPPCHSTAQPLKFSRARKNRQGLGVGHGQPQAVAHPRHRRTRARNPSGWVTRGSRGPVREGAPGGAAQGGRGACRPTPRSALGAGGTPGGCLYPAPLGGPDIGIPRAAGERHCFSNV